MEIFQLFWVPLISLQKWSYSSVCRRRCIGHTLPLPQLTYSKNLTIYKESWRDQFLIEYCLQSLFFSMIYLISFPSLDLLCHSVKVGDKDHCSLELPFFAEKPVQYEVPSPCWPGESLLIHETTLGNFWDDNWNLVLIP